MFWPFKVVNRLGSSGKSDIGPGLDWIVVTSTGTAYELDVTVLSSTGVSYTVVDSVRDSSGTSYIPI